MEFENIPWSFGTGKVNGYVYEIRFRQIDKIVTKSNYETRLNIFWEMEAPSDIGLASLEEINLLQIFENRLVETVESDEQSILSMVLTGNNKREFVFHTKDQEEFLNRLTNMPQEEEIYPIEINSNDDSEWEYDKRVIAQLKVK